MMFQILLYWQQLQWVGSSLIEFFKFCQKIGIFHDILLHNIENLLWQWKIEREAIIFSYFPGIWMQIKVRCPLNHIGKRTVEMHCTIALCRRSEVTQAAMLRLHDQAQFVGDTIWTKKIIQNISKIFLTCRPCSACWGWCAAGAGPACGSRACTSARSSRPSGCRLAPSARTCQGWCYYVVMLGIQDCTQKYCVLALAFIPGWWSSGANIPCRSGPVTNSAGPDSTTTKFQIAN